MAKRRAANHTIARAVLVAFAGVLLGIAGPGAIGQASAVPQPCRAPALGTAPSPASFLPLPTPPPPVRGTLHPGDKLAVAVFDHPELSGEVVVGSDFTIVVPLAGSVGIKNLTAGGVARAIEKKLVSVVSPSVEVRLVSQSSIVFLAGDATGTLPLKPGERLATALSEAKIASIGDLTRIRIIRDGVLSGPWNVRPAAAANDAGPVLASGDVISIPNKPVLVRLSGAVKAPMTAYLDTGEPLGDALAQVQPTDDADVGYIRLTRGAAVCYTSLGGAALAAGGQTGDELMIGRRAHVTVGGSVKRAGVVALKGDRSLVSALALAGGPSKDGNLQAIVVTRAPNGASPSQTPAQSYDLTAFAKGTTSQNPDLFEGDAVYVTQAKPHVDPRALFAAILLAAKKYGKPP